MNLTNSALPVKTPSLNQPKSKNLNNNHNYLQCKFHTNKFHENLLSKRLKQLDVDEMKTRLKNQRDSNELVNFLKKCQVSTGYLDTKLAAHRQGDVSKIMKLNSKPSLPRTTAQPANSTKISDTFQQSSQYLRDTELINMPHRRQPSPIMTRKNLQYFDNLRITSSNTSTPNSNATFQSYSCSNDTSKSSLAASLSSKTTSATSRSTLSNDSFANEPRKLEPVIKPRPQVRRRIVPLNISDSSSENLQATNWYTSTHDFDSDNESQKSSDQSKTSSESTNVVTKSVPEAVVLEVIRIDKQRPIKAAQSKVESKRSGSNLTALPAFESKSVNVLMKSTDFSSVSFKSSEMSPDRRLSHGRLLMGRKESLTQAPVSFPLQVNMSRSLLRKKQSEIEKEYKNFNSTKMSNNLRQTQERIDNRVRRFSNKIIKEVL